MNETLLLMQMIKNGDLNSSDIIVHSYFYDILEKISYNHNPVFSAETWDAINQIASSLNVGDYSNQRIIILDINENVWHKENNYYQIHWRPIILSNFQKEQNESEMYEDWRQIFTCDISYVNPFLPQGDQNIDYAYGILQGQCSFFYHQEERGIADDGYNRVNINTDFGIQNIVVLQHIEPPE